MILRLISLQLTNFKGQNGFFFRLNGKDANIYADNGKGKTTIVDAFSWLLFGKDSMGQGVRVPGKAGFELKTLDSNNEPLHHLEHSVEGILDIDGKPVKLKRVYQEKWVQDRKTGITNLDSHTTDYYIDDKPIKKAAEYATYIMSIADETTFKLLTNPNYFNENLDMKTRRDILIEACKCEIADEDIIASNKDLAPLQWMLQGRTADTLKIIAEDQKTKVKKQQDENRIVIEEKKRELAGSDTADIDEAQLPEDIAALQRQLQEKQQELARIQSGGEVAEKQRRLTEIDTEIMQMKNTAKAKIDKEITEKRTKLDDIQDKGTSLANEIKAFEGDIAYNNKTIEKCEAELDRLRNEWRTIQATGFTFEQDEVCPTCNRPLPAEQLDEARTKAEEAFNEDRAKKLTDNQTKGKATKETVIALNEGNVATQKRIDELTAQKEQLQKEYVVLKQEIDALRQQLQQADTAITSNPEYIQAVQKKNELTEIIAKLGEGNKDAMNKVRTEITQISGDIAALQQMQAKLQQKKQAEARIKELEAKEKELAKQYEQISGQLHLCQEFTRTKVRMLEDSVNAMFDTVKFKMFATQQNGGIVEVCEALVNGVPWGAGLNRGHCNIAGLEIINTLARHYDFFPVVFLDNAEAVTEIPKMQGQIIRLIKPPAFDDLDSVSKIALNERYGGYEEAKAAYMEQISKLRVEVV